MQVGRGCIRQLAAQRAQEPRDRGALLAGGAAQLVEIELQATGGDGLGHLAGGFGRRELKLGQGLEQRRLDLDHRLQERTVACLAGRFAVSEQPGEQAPGAHDS